MNKTELVAAVAEKANLSKKDAEAALEAVVATVEEQVKAGESVQLVGFGTFTRNKQNERVSFGKKTPAKYVPHFKAGKAFKEAVAAVKVK